jgi:hypothetical protein
MPAPPEVAVAVGDAAQSLGELVGSEVGGPAALVCGAPGLAAPLTGATPRALALALDAPASANAVKLGSIRWATRKVSFVGLRG